MRSNSLITGSQLQLNNGYTTTFRDYLNLSINNES